MPFETLAAPAPSSLARTKKSTKSASIMSGVMVGCDLAALSVLFFLIVACRHAFTSSYQFSSWYQFVPCTLMLSVAFGIQGLYPGVLLHPAEEMRRIFVSVSIVFLIFASATFIWRNGGEYSRSVFLVALAAGTPVVQLFRHLARNFLCTKEWWGVSAVILGSGETACRAARSLQNGKLGIRVTEMVSEDQIARWAGCDNSELPANSGRPQPLLDSQPQYAIIAMPEKSADELRYALQEYCWGFSHVLLIPDLRGLCSLGVTAREVGSQVALEIPQQLFHRTDAALKRTIDLTTSALALILLAPLFAVIAVAIKLTSRGPIFYGHTRHGRDGVIFRAFKFRTMRQRSDQLLRDYLDHNREAKLEWEKGQKLKKDPRVTPVGRWLRRFSLDELPQLLNVAVGRMSLVGPRPIVKAEIEKYGRGYGLYTRVLPGITGLWQVSGRNNTTYEERVAFDEYYVRNWSVWLDIYILIRTAKVVITADGAY